jgi:predicted transcriptional regulator of viral defense system
LYVFDSDRTGRTADRFVVASKVTDSYLFAYHSALELHGVARSAFFSDIYVASPRRFRGFDYEGDEIHHVHIDPDLLEDAVTEHTRSGQSLQVASRELTLIQCLDRLEYAGGLEEVIDSVEGFPYLRWGRLEDLLDRFEKKSLYRRVGFVLDYLADRWDPPEELMDRLSEAGAGQPAYFATTPDRGGNLVRRWNLLVPDRFAGEA